ncbi:nitroreductase family protein [Candidatus Borrarchaeum sp.]|uniref:nitroreductase family protein n=1 Tax=Candidatus Borrarchaeum sp. TaxID=2846742 RepID=UPI00257D484E|nr:nitroreductase family protein [Candidatus Borrarchaeum sp.]
MDVKQAIYERRAFRSLEPIEITDHLINELAESAQLAPSCFNNQPWRFVFVNDSLVLEKLHSSLSSGNVWAFKASLIVAIFSNKEYDCFVKGREYYLFDTGMATAFLILRATEMGLVAHPIAGFNEEIVKSVLEIPEDVTVITLVIIGKHSETISPVLSEKHVKDEQKRPTRFPFEAFVHLNRFKELL